MEEGKGKEKMRDSSRKEGTDDAETDSDDGFEQESHYYTISNNSSCAKNRNKGLVLGGYGSSRKASPSGAAAAAAGCMKYCQAERCSADLSDARPYHKRHRVCEKHAKAQAVLVAGVLQRFCQQCSRFHEVSEFDSTKRSCRRRLAGHNQRRRKSSAAGQASEKPRIINTSVRNNVTYGQLRIG